MPKSTVKSTRSKPAKPYDDFLLFAPAIGRWAKKIRGRMEYFGTWEAGWQKALDNYLAWRDDLYAGRRPAKQGSGRLSMRDLCNAFRESKEGKHETGELVDISWLQMSHLDAICPVPKYPRRPTTTGRGASSI